MEDELLTTAELLECIKECRDDFNYWRDKAIAYRDNGENYRCYASLIQAHKAKNDLMWAEQQLYL